MTINTLRHREIFDADEYADKPIVVVGAGAIGSRVAENLVSTGLTSLTFIDFDVVESHNLANQLYTRRDIGMPKIEALKRWAIDKCGQDAVDRMTFINGKVDRHTTGWFEGAHVVISCVDSFSGRREVMERAKAGWADMFIDTRMATGHCVQHMVRVDDNTAVEAWQATLGEDGGEQYERSACGSSLTVGATAQTIGAITAWSVMNYLRTQYVEPILRADTGPWMINRVGG